MGDRDGYTHIHIPHRRHGVCFVVFGDFLCWSWSMVFIENGKKMPAYRT